MQDVERPKRPNAPAEMNWGSDVSAEMLRTFDIPYIAMNPGARYRSKR
jgi:hypothetical protein